MRHDLGDIVLTPQKPEQLLKQLPQDRIAHESDGNPRRISLVKKVYSPPPPLGETLLKSIEVIEVHGTKY